METTRFDELAATRGLEAAGMERTQAEAVLETIRASHGDLATKGDLRNSIQELRTELQGEMRAGFQELRADIYRMMMVQSLAIVTVVVGLTKLLP